MQLNEEKRPDFNAFGITSEWLKDHRPGGRTLLVVYAHPDDETFGNAGTLARYSAAGVNVHYACGTRGEVGSVEDSHLENHADIASLRTAELKCAASALGLTAVHFLGYRDSGMPGTPDNEHPQALHQAPLEQVSAQLVALIRALKPQVLLTFGPFGGYGHPDHIKMHQASVKAFKASREPGYSLEQQPDLPAWTPHRLYYTTFPTRTLKVGIGALRLIGKDPARFGENNDVDLVEALRQATPVTTVIQCGDFIRVRDKAMLCHRSQLGGMGAMQRIPEAIRRLFYGQEFFTRAYPAWNFNNTREHDFFQELPS